MALLLATVTSGGAVNYSLACSTGSYSVTGQNASLKVSRTLTCSPGSYALSGQALGFGVAKRLTCTAGSYVVSGIAATLTYTQGVGATNYSLTCVSGSYAVTGIALGFAVSKRLVCVTGNYTVSGIDALLAYTPGASAVNYSLVCDKGSYIMSGSDARLAHSATGQNTLGGIQPYYYRPRHEPLRAQKTAIPPQGDNLRQTVNNLQLGRQTVNKGLQREKAVNAVKEARKALYDAEQEARQAEHGLNDAQRRLVAYLEQQEAEIDETIVRLIMELI
jgi:hypothetical protein